MSDARLPPKVKEQQQQQQSEQEAIKQIEEDRASQARQQATPTMDASPAFYPSRQEHGSNYERSAGSSRRPYDAVLDASPPPSSVLTDPRRTNSISSGSRPFSTYGMPFASDLTGSYSISSSSSFVQKADAPAAIRQAKKTSRAGQQPYYSPSIRSSRPPGYTGDSYSTDPTPSADGNPTASYQQSQQASSNRTGPRFDATKQRKPSVQGWAGTRDGLRYRLIVVQHPTRARMCGFGDKDRRPLSPTLIVKLIVTDEQTGQEVSPWKINTSLFFLASDLCHPDDLMLSPRNVLVHQHAASVPAASLLQSSYSTEYQQQQQQQQQQNGPTSPYGPPSASSSSSNAPLPPLSSLQVGDRSSRGRLEDSAQHPPPPSLPSASTSHPSALTTITTEHYTRNLVGAAVTSANVLRDEQDNYCIFFVMQDLSVRTEGTYRIRLMFTNLALYDGQTNEGVSEALAEVYTEPFSVYSPRRFPGMLEPTELSKKLASQGIKIAVRSDKKKRQRSQEIAGGSTLPGEQETMEEEEDE